MESIKRNTTLWNELREFDIYVPDYQRDYAQGRVDNGRIDNIREVFVTELYDAVCNGNRCHTGLVYGSYDDGKKVFVAVDGQQRMTTVFLFHWYILWRQGKMKNNKGTLEKFKWATRNYSSQFVDLLFVVEYDGKRGAIEILEHHIDFFTIWKKDPTVKSMMVMIEEIEKQYREVDVENLINGSNIEFDILKLSKGSDGRTYVKMNSRGRQLTTYENFKAKWIDYQREKKIEMDTISKKMDNEWLSFMLNLSKSKDGSFGDPDVFFMQFINEYTYITIVNEEAKKEQEVLFKAKKTDEHEDVPFLSFSEYASAFDSENKVLDFERRFDYIVGNYNEIKGVYKDLKFADDDKFFLDAVIKQSDTEYAHRALFYALIKYADLTDGKEFNRGEYRRWNRVFRNLVENSTINAENIVKVRDSIDKIDNSDIYGYLYSNENTTPFLVGFDSSQVKEEVEKAKKIKENEEWEKNIEEAEKCEFAKGSIRFLFRNERGQYEWSNFGDKFCIASRIPTRSDDNKDFKLLKSLFSNFTSWEQYKEVYLNNAADNWKHCILLNNRLMAPVHFLLMGVNNIGEPIEKHKYIRTQLIETDLIDYLANRKPNNFKIEEGNVIKISNGWKSRSGDYWFYIGKRNDVLLKFLKEGKIETKQSVDENRNLFWGSDVDFKYRGCNIRWKCSKHICIIDEWEENPITGESSKYIIDISDINNIDKELDKLVISYEKDKEKCAE